MFVKCDDIGTQQFYWVLFALVVCTHAKIDYSDHIRKFPDRPNLVLIVADDMGWGDVGANWPGAAITPNIDRLASLGLRMTDFHAGASVCTPSRAALLTGRLPLRTGVVKNFVPESVGGIPINEMTVGEVLQNASYRTAMLGKWHLGLTSGHHPLDRGFSRYLGVPYSVDMGCTDDPGENLPQCQPCQHGNSINQFSEVNTKCPFDYVGLPLYSNRTVLHQPASLQELSTAYASFAEDFIRDSDSRPYFLYAAPSHVHVPLAHAAQFENVTGQGVFADTLYELDWLVGAILSAVARGPGGLTNTLVWFTSDNGPWEAKCGLAGSAGDFTAQWQRTAGGGGSGSKATVWEGGHRVPSILFWPGVIQAGSTSNALLSALDVLPTLVRLTNASLPSHRHFDGLDVTDVILGSSDSGHKVLFHLNGNSDVLCYDVGALRISSYKVVYYTGGVPDCSGRVGPLRYYPDAPLIFDLAADPTESSPLDSSSLTYLAVLQSATMALLELEGDVRTDNISTVDYRTSTAAKPCCWDESPICRCPWD